MNRLYEYFQSVKDGRSVFDEDVTRWDKFCVWVVLNVYAGRHWKEVWGGYNGLLLQEKAKNKRLLLRLERLLEFAAACPDGPHDPRPYFGERHALGVGETLPDENPYAELADEEFLKQVAP